FTVTGDMLTRAGGTLDSSTLEPTTPAPTYYSRANVTLTGKIATGDLWTVTLDGRDYQYQVKDTDTTYGQIVTGLANTINAKVPLNATPAVAAAAATATYSAAPLGTGPSTLVITDPNGFWLNLRPATDTAGMVTRAGSVQGNATLRLTSADVEFANGSGTANNAVAIGDTWKVTLTQNGVSTDYFYTATAASLDEVAAGLMAAIQLPANR